MFHFEKITQPACGHASLLSLVTKWHQVDAVCSKCHLCMCFYHRVQGFNTFMQIFYSGFIESVLTFSSLLSAALVHIRWRPKTEFKMLLKFTQNYRDGPQWHFRPLRGKDLGKGPEESWHTRPADSWGNSCCFPRIEDTLCLDVRLTDLRPLLFQLRVPFKNSLWFLIYFKFV